MASDSLPPPSLSSSKFSQVVIDDDDAGVVPELPKSRSNDPTQRQRTRVSIDRDAQRQALCSLLDGAPFRHAGQGVDVPLFRHTDQSHVGLRPLHLPLMRQGSSDGKSISRDDKYFPHESEELLPRGHRYTSSDVAYHPVIPSFPSASSKYKSPPTSTVPFSFHRKPRKHPFADNYEVPQWRLLILHLGLCALAYPFLLVFVMASRGTTLFWARVFVSVGCGVVGVLLGSSLMNLARAIMEAATWATIIHQSRWRNTPGVRLKDLAIHCKDPLGYLGAIRLLWDRHSYRGADREYRQLYDKRPWSLWLLYFLLNFSVASILPFLLGRLVQIEVTVVHQYENYYEVLVAADVSQADVDRAKALLPAFENFLLTWTMAPFSTDGGLPPVISFPWKNDTVYFSEIMASQLIPGGSGFGTFVANATSASEYETVGSITEEVQAALSVNSSSLLRFPRWGIRINCLKIPDLPNHVIPMSENNFTYLFTPRETLQILFREFSLPFPGDLEHSFNFSSIVYPGDTLPAGINQSAISMGAQFWDNGVAHSLKSTPLDMGQTFNGFITLEHILVRLNDTFAPKGIFGIKGSPLPNAKGLNTSIGLDAAVCLELYEPWVLEIYNNSIGPPTSTRIVDNASFVSDSNSQEKMKGYKIKNPSVKKSLNSTNITPIYVAAHQNSVNQILKDNGRDANYVPSPTLISFTDGDGPYGYTELSKDYYAVARARADATNVLPYFSGSGMTVARQYKDQFITNTYMKNLQMALTITVIFAMGAISALFVPRLPLEIPRRGFDLFSWFAAFYCQELVIDKAVVISKNINLRDLVEYIGDLKVYHPLE